MINRKPKIAAVLALLLMPLTVSADNPQQAADPNSTGVMNAYPEQQSASVQSAVENQQAVHDAMATQTAVTVSINSGASNQRPPAVPPVNNPVPPPPVPPDEPSPPTVGTFNNIIAQDSFQALAANEPALQYPSLSGAFYTQSKQIWQAMANRFPNGNALTGALTTLENVENSITTNGLQSSDPADQRRLSEAVVNCQAAYYQVWVEKWNTARAAVTAPNATPAQWDEYFFLQEQAQNYLNGMSGGVSDGLVVSPVGPYPPQLPTFASIQAATTNAEFTAIGNGLLATRQYVDYALTDSLTSARSALTRVQAIDLDLAQRSVALGNGPFPAGSQQAQLRAIINRQQMAAVFRTAQIQAYISFIETYRTYLDAEVGIREQEFRDRLNLLRPPDFHNETYYTGYAPDDGGNSQGDYLTPHTI